MLFVAFLRNVNLGQPKSPTRAQLELAFLQAGAAIAESFLSNGTLVYSVPRSRLAQNTANQACEILEHLCGMNEPAFAYSFRQLAKFVAEEPFSEFDNSDIAERAVTFFKPKVGRMAQALIESARKDCLVFRIETGIAFSITREVSGKIGYPTPVLEKALNRPVTTRSWTTILRLVKKHS
jgi:uncharacterized protein (DUF1697 family)